MRLSVIIPVYNEEQTIQEVLERVAAVNIDLGGIAMEIVIANDGSTDGTRRAIDERRLPPDLPVHVYHSPINLGKGAAVRMGLTFATGDILLIQDADLELDPAEYTRLLKPILDGRADVVYGSRLHSSRPHRVLYFWHSVGNKALTLLSNMFTNLNLTDMETCYKVFRLEVLESLDLCEDRFGIEPEITAKVAAGGWRVYEIGISYSGRTYEQGKKIGWKDGVWAVRCIVRYSQLGRRFKAGG